MALAKITPANFSRFELVRKYALILLCISACVRLQAQEYIINTICGNDTAGYGGDNGPAIRAKLNVPFRICLDKYDNIYIADALNHSIRKIATSTGIVTTIAGIDSVGFTDDGGPATNAKMFVTQGVSVDTADNVYIVDAGNNRIRKITASTGIITTIAGSGPAGTTFGDSTGDGGQATDATLSAPSGICLDKFGSIYIADYSNNKIRKIDAVTGIIRTVAGKGTKDYIGGFAGYSGDGGPATAATFSGTIQVFVDHFGNIFICDQWNHALRKVDAFSGIIYTIAGNGYAGHTGDGGPSHLAQLNQPCGVYVDMQDNIFIAEYNVIRRIDGATGIISTVAGTGITGFSGDGGPATNAELNCSDVFLDNYGHIFIADINNNRIREVFDPATVGVHNAPINADIQVYPNPTKEELTITGIQQNTSYRLLTMTGICLQQGTLNPGGNTLPLHDLAPGIYILEFLLPSGDRSIRRIVKE